MFISMLFLSFFTIFIGFTTSDIYSGYGNIYLTNSIFVLYSNFNCIEPDFLPVYIKLLPLFVTFLGLIFSIFIFFYLKNINEKNLYFFYYLNKNLNNFFYPAGFFNQLYNIFFIKFFIFSYNVSTKLIDKVFWNFLVHLVYIIFFIN